MEKSSTDYLLFYLMLLFFYGIIISAIVHKMVDVDSFASPPIPVNQTGNFILDSVNGIDYMGEVIGYYFNIMFLYDDTISIVSGIMVILSIIAVFILITELIYPLLAIIVPDWL